LIDGKLVIDNCGMDKAMSALTAIKINADYRKTKVFSDKTMSF
jgi:hypothetical protein